MQESLKKVKCKKCRVKFKEYEDLVEHVKVKHESYYLQVKEFIEETKYERSKSNVESLQCCCLF